MIYSFKHNKLIFYMGYMVAFITLLSLFLLAKATEGSEKFEELYQILLITIISGIVCLFIIVIFFLHKTIKNYSQKIPGASLSINILSRTLLLAFIPLLFISFFAFKFLRYEFQASFDEGINDALNNSLVLSQKALDVRALNALQESLSVAQLIASYEYTFLQSYLENIRNDIGAYELTVFDEKGFIQALASLDKNTIVPNIPEHSDFNRVNNEGDIFVVESDGSLFQIRTLVTISKPESPNYYLQSIFRVPDTISKLTQQVNETINERDKFNYLMPRVNSSFIFVLILVLLLAGLLLILSSIAFANHMVEPIGDLVVGTENISKGNFSQPLNIKRQDDFGILINAFNLMTQSLKKATEEATLHKNKVESERAYLATVINRMTAAVITLDHQYKLLTHNERAETLLDCELGNAVYVDLKHIDLSLEHYKNFINQLDMSSINKASPEIEVHLNHDTEIKHLIARVTPLPSTDDLHGGYVIIFDEMGQYLQEQKQAAWEEVARRLAHEIKNPLTPILLAAERLNYKLSGHLQEEQQQVLNRSIEVISNQVKSLKNMVDDFSNFAKPNNEKKTTIAVHSLLKDVFDLYKGHYSTVKFELATQAEIDVVKANANLLRQVLHNLIKNAIEACENKNPGMIVVSTYNTNDSIAIAISDNGMGLPTEKSGHIFDPYITTKEKGTGLGLAIVKKIIQEHQGSIKLNNQINEEKLVSGVIATILLPVKRSAGKIALN